MGTNLKPGGLVHKDGGEDNGRLSFLLAVGREEVAGRFRLLYASSGVPVNGGEAGGDWFLVRRNGKWDQVLEGTAPTARVTLGQDSAWKVFTKRRDRQAALAKFPKIAIDGDRELGLYVLDMVSVMA